VRGCRAAPLYGSFVGLFREHAELEPVGPAPGCASGPVYAPSVLICVRGVSWSLIHDAFALCQEDLDRGKGAADSGLGDVK
jgi:hypothetical protein